MNSLGSRTGYTCTFLYTFIIDLICAYMCIFIHLQRRMYDAESMAASSIEAVRQDTASAGSILSAQIAACNASIAALDRKVSEMENKYIYLSEDIISKVSSMYLSFWTFCYPVFIGLRGLMH